MALIDPAPLLAFSEAAKVFRGDEKGEAQTFLNRFFAAFGYADAIAAGAVFETRVAKGSASGHTGFADLVWRSSDKPPRPGVLFEMKKRGEPLEKHRRQAFTYWERLVPNRPRYVVLCNFDWFWIYDFDTQIDEPVDRIALADLSQRSSAFAFMKPGETKPVFNNNQQEITQEAAMRMGQLYRDLEKRLCTKSSDIKPLQIQRFVLQCVLAMFAEDRGLLPQDIFTRSVLDCLEGESAYDLIGGLFLQMNLPGVTQGRRFKGVDYFNGGLFSEILPIDLEIQELEILKVAAQEDWSQIRPAIFGSIFEGTANGDERRAHGMHFTSEIDIMKIVRPTISHYWEAKIEAAKTVNDFEKLHQELIEYRVLDPACGSGNFLYVAYQEMKDLEKVILDRICDLKQSVQIPLRSVSPLQFFGIDINSFAVQLAQVTMTIARKVAIDRLQSAEQALPLDTLNQNIVQQDALFEPWPQADAIIGNPPFLGGSRIRSELGDRYAERVFKQFFDIRAQVDFASYWFRLAHENLPSHGRAGLVATNSIAQGKSRSVSLDYIVQNGGFIYNAVSSQPWSGEAAVYVSIVNWGKQKPVRCHLDEKSVEVITSSLSSNIDVCLSRSLQSNRNVAFIGVQPNSKGFFIPEQDAMAWILKNPKNSEVLKLFSMGSNLTHNPHGKPERWIIDFSDRNLEEIGEYLEPLEWAKLHVKPERIQNRESILREKWWRFKRTNAALRQAIHGLQFYFAVSAHSKWFIFIPVPRDVLPANSTVVIASDDFYVLGILTSNVHRQWVKAQASTLKGDTRYTPNTCFETFPFPQKPSQKVISDIRQIAQDLHDYRTQIMEQRQWGITQLYNGYFHEPASGLAKLHAKLDKAVLKAYGFQTSDDILEKLLALNLELSEKEQQGEAIVGPWALDRPPSDRSN
ncbi:restriction endonuclease subunit M [Limnothrix sp. PR1529]|uniref:DNA methyltransferase n=1 Tax=Limnothrix sp. PR1529 TaxID=1704291 RepID=UPI00081E1FD7|nr:DNA methyltransferase [Limnothrix sp. PR1529]OCQ89158.1 restriction endonuclease subunit M [Limnothrix sp. P13C2]PIB15225.1 restriction endonuclease subunit M [Limnothrix sp. PR1529]